MTDLIDTTEMYLRTILELEEENVTPLRARISERLGHSGPTVSQTVGRMERDGLVVVTEDRRLELTAAGRAEAVSVMRKHRLAERLLLDVIGLKWEQVHDEACRWEHVMSENVERRLIEILDMPITSPYGNPIPGLAELGVKQPRMFHQEVVDVVTMLERNMYTECVATVKFLGESVQIDEDTLHEFATAELLPGVKASFRLNGKRVVARNLDSDMELELTRGLASGVFVLDSR